MNNDSGVISSSTVTNAGVGIETNILTTSTVNTYDVSGGAFNDSFDLYNTVTNPSIYGIADYQGDNENNYQGVKEDTVKFDGTDPQ